MSAYTYSYNGKNFRIQIQGVYITPDSVSVRYTKLNMETYDVDSVDYFLEKEDVADFFDHTPGGKQLGDAVFDYLADLALTKIKDIVVLDNKPVPEEHQSPVWQKATSARLQK